MCDTHAATLRDGLREGRIASFYGGACTFVSFQFRPGLGRLDETARTFKVRATLTEGIAGLKPGMAIVVSIAFAGIPQATVSFQFRPGLSRLDEAAQLLEQGAGGCAFAVELFDPVEPGQYCAGLVHVDEASVRNRTAMRRLRVFLDSVDAGLPQVR